MPSWSPQEHDGDLGSGAVFPTVVFRLCGHPEISPKPVPDQSRTRMSAPVSHRRQESYRCSRNFSCACGNLNTTQFCTVKVVWLTSVSAANRPSAVEAREAKSRNFLGTSDEEPRGGARNVAALFWKASRGTCDVRYGYPKPIGAARWTAT